MSNSRMSTLSSSAVGTAAQQGQVESPKGIVFLFLFIHSLLWPHHGLLHPFPVLFLQKIHPSFPLLLHLDSSVSKRKKKKSFLPHLHSRVTSGSSSGLKSLPRRQSSYSLSLCHRTGGEEGPGEGGLHPRGTWHLRAEGAGTLHLRSSLKAGGYRIGEGFARDLCGCYTSLGTAAELL